MSEAKNPRKSKWVEKFQRFGAAEDLLGFVIFLIVGYGMLGFLFTDVYLDMGGVVRGWSCEGVNISWTFHRIVAIGIGSLIPAVLCGYVAKRVTASLWNLGGS